MGMRASVCVAVVVGVSLVLGCGSDFSSSGPDGWPELGHELDFNDGIDTGLELVCPERDLCTETYCDQVLIPAGEFLMGSDHPPHPDSYWPSGDERPIHSVQLDTFCIDKYEVTLERYEACVQAGECTPNGLEWRKTGFGYDTVVNHYPPECQGGNLASCWNHAVNGKSYWQAQGFCAYMGSRLCTEAEWERAANGPGPDQRRHPWGDAEPTSALVNIPSVGTGYVEDVDTCADGVSVEGVFNLAGNVYEWVEDAYDTYEVAPEGEALYDPTNPPSGPEDDAVGRGSCFFTEPEHTVAERSIFSLQFDWG